MKTIMKILFIPVILLISFNFSYSQEFKKNINGVEKINIAKLTNFTVEGYSGKEIIITSEDFKKPKEREDGLRPVFGSGQDNTGLGIYLVTKDGELKISPVMKEATNSKYHIKIPKNIDVIIPKSNLFDMDFNDFSFASPDYIEGLELQKQVKQIMLQETEIAMQAEKIAEIVTEATLQNVNEAEIADQVKEMCRIVKEERKNKAKTITIINSNDNNVYDYTELDRDNDKDLDYDSDYDNDYYYVGPGVQIYSDETKRQDLKFKNLEGEIEINATNANITLENITGPAVVYLSSGNIKADFSQLNQKYPVLFTTMNGEIDINLPSSTKANLKIANLSNSQTFTDFDFDFEDDNKAYREGFLGNMIKCQINGGGVEMQLRATNGDVFIRKK